MMHQATIRDIESCLEWMPASNQDLVTLGLEELHRPAGDRPEVYRLLEHFKRAE